MLTAITWAACLPSCATFVRVNCGLVIIRPSPPTSNCSAKLHRSASASVHFRRATPWPSAVLPCASSPQHLVISPAAPPPTTTRLSCISATPVTPPCSRATPKRPAKLPCCRCLPATSLPTCSKSAITGARHPPHCPFSHALRRISPSFLLAPSTVITIRAGRRSTSSKTRAHIPGAPTCSASPPSTSTVRARTRRTYLDTFQDHFSAAPHPYQV